MGTKIQINSLKALERLIGGDSEIEIEIRKSIVAEFAKRHLRSIVADIDKIIGEIAIKEFSGCFGKITRNNTWTGEHFEISDEIKRVIKGQISPIVNKKLSEAINEVVIDVKYIDELVKYYVDKSFEDRVNQKVAEKINKIWK